MKHSLLPLALGLCLALLPPAGAAAATIPGTQGHTQYMTDKYGEDQAAQILGSYSRSASGTNAIQRAPKDEPTLADRRLTLHMALTPTNGGKGVEGWVYVYGVLVDGLRLEFGAYVGDQYVPMGASYRVDEPAISLKDFYNGGKDWYTVRAYDKGGRVVYEEAVHPLLVDYVWQ